MTWFALPLLLLSALNIVLAMVATRRTRAAWGAGLVFALAGALLGVGVWRSSAALVGCGLLASLAAPLWMGVVLRGRPQAGHHLARAALLAVSFWLWLSFRPA